MGPEILIVGDRSQRGSLLPRVQDLGYLVTPVRERELTARVEANPAPVAVLICLGGEDPANLIDAVRSGRDDVPVILYGSLGGAVHDLADVLELGADHFLAEPVGDEELASVLAEMAGPGDDPAADAEERENVLAVTQQGPPGPIAQAADPVLGQLHRTLEMLAARLHSDEAAEPERDELDLEALGLGAVPDVDAAAGNEAELDPDRGRRETSDPSAPRRPDTTLRLNGVEAGRDGKEAQQAVPPESTLRLGREASGGRREAPTRISAPRGREPEAARGAAVREDRSSEPEVGPVREDRSSGEVTARVVVRPDVMSRHDLIRSEVASRFEAARQESLRREAQDVTRSIQLRQEVGQGDAARREGTARVEVRSEPRVGSPRQEVGQGEAARRDATAQVVVRSEPRVGSLRQEVGQGEAARRDATARVDVARREPTARAGGERLAGLDVVMRVARMHRQRSHGRVVVGFTGGVTREVWWRAGEPVFATSSATGDGLTARLVARGLISRGEAAQAGARVDGDVVASSRRLVQAGLIKPREQAEAVRDVVESIVLSLCSDEATRWSMDASAPPTTVTLGVPVISLVARGARLGLSAGRLREGLAGSTFLKVQEVEGVAELLGDPDADGWLGLLDGTRSLDELVVEDGVEEHALWSAACVLVAMGLAVEVDESASLVAIDRRRVGERLALAHASDYFTMLGLTRTAGRAEVVRAHADLRATFAPERLEPASRTALAEPLRELQAALDEARDVLLDEALRTAYLARLAEEEA